MRAWKPASKIDLQGLEDRLPPSKKVVTMWKPEGSFYMIVNSKPPGYRSNGKR